MKRLTITAALGALAIACGGGSNGGGTKSFNYPSTGTTTLTQPEQETVDAAKSAIGDAMSFAPQTDDPTSIMTLGGLALAALPWQDSGQAVQNLLPPVLQQAPIQECVSETATSNSITFTYVDCDISTGTKLNGHFTATETGTNSGTLNWDLTQTTTSGSTIMSWRYSGNFSGNPEAASGGAKAELTSIVNNSTSMALYWSIDLDAAITATQKCISSGWLEAKRVWTVKPQGATGTIFDDAGIKFTWSSPDTLGCASTLTVYHSL